MRRTVITLATVARTECVLRSRPGVTNEVRSDNFEMKESTVRTEDMPSGSVLCKTRFLSVDPYMRCMFDEDHPQLGEYLTTFKLGAPLSGGGVGEVLSSKAEGFTTGDIVCVPFQGYPWGTVAELHESQLTKAPCLDYASHLLGALGIPGITAYFGFHEASKPSPGDTIVVSGAAGATGAVYCQLAVMHGCKVVGICGSDEKCAFLESLGVTAVNYKSPALHADLAAALPAGADIYFDNVGGTVSDTVIRLMNDGGKIPICGQIAVYSEDVPYPPPLSPALQEFTDSKNITRFRYLCLDYEPRFPEAVANLTALMTEGKLLPKETVTEGFRPHEAFMDMMKGGNIGKAIVRV